MKFAIFFCLLVPLATSITLDCDFNSSGWGAKAIQTYYCQVSNIVVDSPVETIESVDGVHLTDRNNTNVYNFKIVSSPDLLFMPHGIEAFFPKIRGVYVENSGLTVITQSDFKPFPDLRLLHLTGNKLTILSSGLFEFNPKLRKINFTNNQLNAISADIFDPLEDLTFVKFANNVCIDKNATNKEEVEEIKKEIADKCQN